MSDPKDVIPQNGLGPGVEEAKRARPAFRKSEIFTVSLAKFLSLTAVAFLTMVLHSLPLRWGGNEFFYLSQVFFSSDENIGIFASGFPNHPAQLFILMASGLLSWLPIESAGLVLRLIGYLLLALGIATLSKALNIGPLAVSLGLSAFLIFGQTYLGGEWLVNGIETKVPAYAIGFGSLGLLLNGRRSIAWFLGALATFFHPLVGLIFLVVLMVLEQSKKKPVSGKSLVIPGIAFGVAVTYIAVLRVVGLGESPENSELARKIYTIVRHPHHLAPFGGLHPIDGSEIEGWFAFSSLVLPGILAILLFLAVRLEKRRRFKNFLRVTLWLHLWIPASLALAWLDKEAQNLGPLYIFRPLSLLLLLSLLGLAGFIFGQSGTWKLGKFFVAILLSWVLSGAPGPGDFTPMPKWAEITDSGQQVLDMLSSNTSSRDTILVDFENLGGGQTGLNEQNFEVASGRGQIAVWKFVPTRDSDILIWWFALQERDLILTRNCSDIESSFWNYLLISASGLPEGLEQEIVAERHGFVLLSLQNDALSLLCET